ncbi:MAG: isoleucine--tRNA ligase [PVC group bacterium]|nr:isoleucine--tRNA ligase [PVC group bacterium]
MDYKKTINLPKTDFPMKANLSNKEPLILENWKNQQLYKKMLEQAGSKPKYVLHDGPPYANGNIHIGHALNKILKDIIVKYKSMRGFFTAYVPGWDCHGLPVELQLFKKLKKRKDQVDQVEFRKQAHDFAMRFVDIQREEFKRLGVFGDWENPYLTLAHSYEAAIIRSFGALVGKGYIYKGCKPVNWCSNCETALAEAEVEYENHTSPSVFVKFAIPDISNVPDTEGAGTDKFHLVIWTTTPWTLLGNVACAVHPEFTYVYAKVGDEVLVLEKNLVQSVLEKAGITDYKIVGESKGLNLEDLEYNQPFGRRGKVVLADYVSCEDGSGIVHTAPGYGTEDFMTGKRYGLDVVMQVDDKGRFFSNIPQFGGLHVHKANPLIVETLKEKGELLAGLDIQHSYPHCWRCKKPIIFRATDQWFMSIDHKALRNKILGEIPHLRWVPGFGENRITSMVESRPDWCLSRQRLWGVPIPVFYCVKCNTSVLDKNVIEHFAEIVESVGTDSWFSKEAKELLPDGFVCSGCQSTEFKKETDILDVWFDSGVSHQAVVKQNPNLQYPADLYLEGSDQHRGWFQASLIPGMAIDGCAPFKGVLTHGFAVDGEGKKMSKSRGNVIAPQTVINKLGADVLRLWVASSDYTGDVRISDEILARGSESYRKIRNTLKFILGNLFDFDPNKDVVAYEDLQEIDRWALSALHKLLKQVTDAYEKFAFYQVNKLIYNFCIVEMSSFYLDVLKDRLYTSAAGATVRRSSQTVLYEILLSIIKVIAPVLSFTAEEAYGFVPAKTEDSVFLTEWPECKEEHIKEDLNCTWKVLLDVRNCVLKVLEEARSSKLIGNSLEAKVVIFYSKDDARMREMLEGYLGQLPGIFIVSQVELNSDIDSADLPVYNVDLLQQNAEIVQGQMKIKIESAQGTKCIRCWNYAQSVGSNEQHPSLCARCVENI